MLCTKFVWSWLQNVLVLMEIGSVEHPIEEFEVRGAENVTDEAMFTSAAKRPN